MLLVMVVMGASYTAIDLTAGEKERGTLETLLLAPVKVWGPDRQVHRGLHHRAVHSPVEPDDDGADLWHRNERRGQRGDLLHLSGSQVAMILGALLPFVALMSALALVLGSMAKSTKEGQTLITPLVFLSMVPGIGAMAPGVELGLGTSWIPLLNVGLLMKGACGERDVGRCPHRGGLHLGPRGARGGGRRQRLSSQRGAAVRRHRGVEGPFPLRELSQVRRSAGDGQPAVDQRCAR